ncbi:hypothetical protein HPP92_013454 [Vanilla planifolia]|uniref:Uncharacterized protein n=1 Tax=Vanilla planifolia TaxID=51239 RepID=A0A835V006_VANPL|nr:hypothetical protein HPP92_013454 [Vanilla planifolia]
MGGIDLIKKEIMRLKWVRVCPLQLLRRGASHLHAEDCKEMSTLRFHGEELGLGASKLRLELGYLLLKQADGTCTTVDRVSHPRIRLIHYAAHRVTSLAFWQLLESCNAWSQWVNDREIYICRWKKKQMHGFVLGGV